MSSEHVAALCDVDRNALDQAAATFPQARKGLDFRRLFDRPGDFDAVVVSTADAPHPRDRGADRAPGVGRLA